MCEDRIVDTAGFPRPSTQRRADQQPTLVASQVVRCKQEQHTRRWPVTVLLLLEMQRPTAVCSTSHSSLPPAGAKHLATWDVKRPCSQWYGVTCDRRHAQGHGTRASPVIPDTGDPIFSLPGPLPAELVSLPELHTLILAGRSEFPIFSFSGPFPGAWAHLGKLSHLDLSGISDLFSPRGQVPLALCNLTSLTYLSLASTGFTAFPKQCTRLSHLSSLDVSSNSLDDIQVLSESH